MTGFTEQFASSRSRSVKADHALADTRDVLTLVAAIQDAATRPHRWSHVLDGIAHATGVWAACLVAEYPDRAWAGLTSPRLDLTSAAAYGDWHKHDPASTHRHRQPVGQPYALDDLIESAQYAESIVYKRYWQAVGARPWIGAQLLARHGVHMGVMLLARPGESDPIDGAQRFEMLAPHLCRALETSWLVRELEVEKAIMAIAGGGKGPYIAIDADKRVLLESEGVERHLGARTGLRVDDGHLVASTSQMERRLKEFVARCIANGSDRPKTAGAVLARADKDAGEPRSVGITAMPLRRAWPDLAGFVPYPAPVAVVTFSDPAHAARERWRVLQDRYGLTPAEADLCNALLVGGGRPELAERLGVSVTTVRTHLSRIFAKTDTNRQAELVGLIYECGQ